MRVVLDTNIFVSMSLGGRVGKLYIAWKARQFTLIVSDEIHSEYLDVLSRPKLHLAAETISIVTAHLQRKAKFVIPSEAIKVIDADPSDNKFLEAALAGKADCVVSGDSHLLDLKTFHGIPVLTAREFIERLEETK